MTTPTVESIAWKLEQSESMTHDEVMWLYENADEVNNYILSDGYEGYISCVCDNGYSQKNYWYYFGSDDDSEESPTTTARIANISLDANLAIKNDVQNALSANMRLASTNPNNLDVFAAIKEDVQKSLEASMAIRGDIYNNLQCKLAIRDILSYDIDFESNVAEDIYSPLDIECRFLADDYIPLNIGMASLGESQTPCDFGMLLIEDLYDQIRLGLERISVQSVKQYGPNNPYACWNSKKSREGLR